MPRFAIQTDDEEKMYAITAEFGRKMLISHALFVTGRSAAVNRALLSTVVAVHQPRRMAKRAPFRTFETHRKMIGLAVMLYIRFPPSLRNAEFLLCDRGHRGQPSGSAGLPDQITPPKVSHNERAATGGRPIKAVIVDCCAGG